MHKMPFLIFQKGFNFVAQSFHKQVTNISKYFIALRVNYVKDYIKVEGLNIFFFKQNFLDNKGFIRKCLIVHTLASGSN